jgi:hypothetical protein
VLRRDAKLNEALIGYASGDAADAGEGEQYDPNTVTQAVRLEKKAEGLAQRPTGDEPSARTLCRWKERREKQGLMGLVDERRTIVAEYPSRG